MDCVPGNADAAFYIALIHYRYCYSTSLVALAHSWIVSSESHSMVIESADVPAEVRLQQLYNSWWGSRQHNISCIRQRSHSTGSACGCARHRFLHFLYRQYFHQFVCFEIFLATVSKVVTNHKSAVSAQVLGREGTFPILIWEISICWKTDGEGPDRNRVDYHRSTPARNCRRIEAANDNCLLKFTFILNKL